MLISNIYRGGTGDELTPKIGGRELVEIHVGETPYWEDTFNRPNSPTLGNGWVGGDELSPANYDRIGIHNNAAVITGYPRPGVYEPENEIKHPPANNQIYAGIGFASRLCPDGWLPDIEIIRDNASWMNPPPIPPYGRSVQVECTPLLHIDVDTDLGGFGCWPSGFHENQPFPIPWGIWGTIGAPPELFATPYSPILASSLFPAAYEGQMSWRIKCTEPGKAILIVNDKQVPVSAVDYTPIEIPSLLLGSRRHGFAVDAHLTRPYSEHIHHPAALSVRFHGLGTEDFEI